MATRSIKRGKRLSPSPKKMPNRSPFHDNGPFPGGTLQNLEVDELNELKARQEEELSELNEGHTKQSDKMKKRQWKGLVKENKRELEKGHKTERKDLKKRHLEQLKELEAQQEKVLLETAQLLDPISYPDGKISLEEMAKCGLKDYKLSEVVLSEPPPEVKDLTVDVMVNDFLMAAFTLKNTLPESWRLKDKKKKEEEDVVINEHLFSEEVDPRPEFSAVLQGLVKYAESVPPHQSLDLFQKYISNKREDKIRGWSYLLKLCGKEQIPFFQKIKTSSQKREFIKRMCKIMGESGKVDVEILGFKTCLIGYTYGFWLAKLYNQQGIEDEQLPLPLLNAKQHFMEYPWDPLSASNGFHYDHFPVKL